MLSGSDGDNGNFCPSGLEEHFNWVASIFWRKTLIPYLPVPDIGWERPGSVWMGVDGIPTTSSNVCILTSPRI